MHVSRANLAITDTAIGGKGGGKLDFVISVGPLATHTTDGRSEKNGTLVVYRLGTAEGTRIACGCASRSKIDMFCVLKCSGEELDFRHVRFDLLPTRRV